MDGKKEGKIKDCHHSSGMNGIGSTSSETTQHVGRDGEKKTMSKLVALFLIFIFIFSSFSLLEKSTR